MGELERFYGEKLTKEESSERLFDLAWNLLPDDIKKSAKCLQKGMIEVKVELENGRQISYWFMMEKDKLERFLTSEKVDE